MTGFRWHCKHGYYLPPVCEKGSLTFDITIASYKIILFSFSFSLIYTTDISMVEVPVEGTVPIILCWISTKTVGSIWTPPLLN